MILLHDGLTTADGYPVSSRDQLFTLQMPGRPLMHLNTTHLGRIHQKFPKVFKAIELGLSQEIHDNVVETKGIEEQHVNTISARRMGEPGLAILLDNDFENGFVPVDGHHRLVKRWRCGLTHMKFLITLEEIWRNVLVELPDSLGRLPIMDTIRKQGSEDRGSLTTHAVFDTKD